VHILPEVLRPVLTAEDRFDPSLMEPLNARFDLMANDLKWWADALSAARAQSTEV